MKNIWLKLYGKPTFDFWFYLWINSGSKPLKFTINDVYLKSMKEIIDPDLIVQEVEDYNLIFFDKKDSKIYCEIVKSNPGLHPTLTIYTIKWFLNGKKVDIIDGEVNNSKENTFKKITDELMKDYLPLFYNLNKYDYPDLKNHRRFVNSILEKITQAIKLRQDNDETELTDEYIMNGFKIFFDSIPKWWIENQVLGLPSINKNFSKILNQIKHESNSKIKQQQQSSEFIDFNELANGNASSSWSNAF